MIGGRRQQPSSHSAESSAESEDTGSTPPVTISSNSTRGITGPAQRRFKQIKEKNQRKTLGNLDELLATSNNAAASNDVMNVPVSSALTTGNAELDRSLYHHMLRCHALLRVSYTFGCSLHFFLPGTVNFVYFCSKEQILNFHGHHFPHVQYTYVNTTSSSYIY